MDADGRGVERGAVDPGAAVDDVVAKAAVEVVVAILTRQMIVAGAAAKIIVAVACVDRVVARSTEQRVVAGCAVDDGHGSLPLLGFVAALCRRRRHDVRECELFSGAPRSPSRQRTRASRRRQPDRNGGNQAAAGVARKL